MLVHWCTCFYTLLLTLMLCLLQSLRLDGLTVDERALLCRIHATLGSWALANTASQHEAAQAHNRQAAAIPGSSFHLVFP